MKNIISSLLVVILLFGIMSVKSLAISSEEIFDYSEIEGLVYVQLVGYKSEGGEFVVLSEPPFIFRSTQPVSFSFRSNIVNVFVGIVIGGVVYSFIVGFIGVDIAYQVGVFARKKVAELYGYLPKYSYSYTIDNGCYSAAFPANPFC